MKNGPTTCASDTARAPVASAASRWAAASWRDAREPRERSGWGTGRRAPRSGQVPTTTGVPRSPSSSIASVRCRTESAVGHPVGHVVAADHDDGDVGAVARRESGELPRQLGALRPDPGRGVQAYGASGALGDASGQATAERVLRGVGAEPGRDRVPEDEQLDRVAVPLLPDLVRVGGDLARGRGG